MGKHETGYARVERDLYPTPPWVVSALAEHVDLRGLTVHEPACGNRHMAEALLLAGCARVYTSDIVDYGAGQDEILDFLSAQMPNLERAPDAIITNPPFGQGGRLATAFIEVGLTRIRRHGGLLALLLPCDFDSAKTRTRYFGDCPDFVAKIVLRKRIVWFQRDDGVLEAPKENSAWFLWQRSLLRTHRPPIILYAPETEPLPKTPDAERADEALRQPEQLQLLRGQTPSTDDTGSAAHG
jgi:hypothetical protein